MSGVLQARSRDLVTAWCFGSAVRNNCHKAPTEWGSKPTMSMLTALNGGNMNPRSRITRRQVFQAAGLAATTGAVARTTAAAGHATSPGTPNIYTRIGVRPFINLTATITISGGTLTLPEVKKAMEEASYHSVNIDELMERVGIRLCPSYWGVNQAS